MPKDGIKKLAVVCPAFVSDCLETLEEIYVEGKEDFMHAGGESFVTIPCLNTQGGLGQPPCILGAQPLRYRSILESVDLLRG